MERPSHIIFDTQSRHFSRRVPLLTVAISLQAVALWLFMHAFVPQTFHLPPGDLTVHLTPDDPTVDNPPPPPPPIQKTIDVPPVPPLVFNTAPEGPHNTITITPVPPANPPGGPVSVDRAAVSI